MAMIHGVLLGIAAVAMLAFFLVGMNGKLPIRAKPEEMVTSGPVVTPEAPMEDREGKGLSFYAKQHGVFSSSEAAAAFIASDPSLSKAAIIKAEEQYYVWSAIGLQSTEIDVSEYEGTFRKPFRLQTASCTSSEISQLVSVLPETDVVKIKSLASSLASSSTDGQASPFVKNITAITAFTSDLRIIRLHLLSHYSNEDPCLKIEF